MKKVFAITMAIVCLLSCGALSVSAAENESATTAETVATTEPTTAHTTADGATDTPETSTTVETDATTEATTTHTGETTDGDTTQTTAVTATTGIADTTETTHHTTTGNGEVTTTSRTTVKNGRITTTAKEGQTAVRTTLPTVPMETVFETTDIMLQAANGAFPKNTVVNVETLADGEGLDVVKKALDDVSQQFTAYEITARSDNVTVQPSGKVTATFTIPEGYEASNTAVVYITPNGVADILVSKVDPQARTVTAELSHFSTYAVAELYSANAADGPDTLTVVLCVLGAALVLGGAGLYMLYRKKNVTAEAAQTAAEE